MYTTSPNGTSLSAPLPVLHSWIHYGWAYVFFWRIHVLGLVCKHLVLKNNLSSSSVSISLCGFQLQTLGKFFASEASLSEVLCQQCLALWLMAGCCRRVQVRGLGAQFLLCLVNSLLLAHQRLCDTTDAHCRCFLLDSNLKETTEFNGPKLSVSAVYSIYLDFSLMITHQ